MMLKTVGLLATLLLFVEGDEYGADVSWPIHHHWDESSVPISPEQKKEYHEFFQGCYEKYAGQEKMCDEVEQQRLDMSLRQPQSMVNYTETGFKKLRAPKEMMKLLTEHWETHKDRKVHENWSAGNIYTNHWKADTYMVNVEDKTLQGAGAALKKQIWDAAKDTLEQWTGMELQPVSMYGIRIYTEGAILSPHVDRLPLVSSCIVNVAQNVDEPWPIEVYDRQGKAVNVTMEPGDMVLYESHSLIHGRPFPLKGEYFANIFIHFEPTGRKIHHRSGEEQGELDADFPPYIIPGSPEEDNWWKFNPNGWKKPSPSASQQDTPEAHLAAATNDVDRLEAIAKKNARFLHNKDRNGWQPIHEAARAGNKDAMEFLVEKGADINARTHNGRGNSPLNLAVEALSENHPVAKYLQSLGALNIGPEL